MSETPPYIGWKVPFTHVIDPYMTISVVHPPPYKAEQAEARATIEKKPNKKPTMKNCVTDKAGPRSAQSGSQEESHGPRSARIVLVICIRDRRRHLPLQVSIGPLLRAQPDVAP